MQCDRCPHATMQKAMVGEEGWEVCLFDAGDSNENACKQTHDYEALDAFYCKWLDIVWYK